MQKPPNLTQLAIFTLLLVAILALVQVGAISLAMDKLGLSPHSIILVLFISLLGSLVNLPLFTLHNTAVTEKPTVPAPRFLFGQMKTYTGKTVIAINVGGALLPVFIAVYLLNQYPLSPLKIGVAIGIVAVVSYLFSRPIHGLGIGIPIFVAPITAALTALLLEPVHTAPLAYIAGTLGILLGADIFRLNSVRSIATPLAAIGGAGTFDGIFLTGIVAVLLT